MFITSFILLKMPIIELHRKIPMEPGGGVLTASLHHTAEYSS